MVAAAAVTACCRHFQLVQLPALLLAMLQLITMMQTTATDDGTERCTAQAGGAVRQANSQTAVTVRGYQKQWRADGLVCRELQKLQSGVLTTGSPS